MCLLPGAIAATNRPAPVGMVVMIGGGDEKQPRCLAATDLGFLYCSDRDVHGANRTRAAGPFFEHDDMGALEFSAFRPFYSVTTDREKNYQVKDYLWPVAVTRTWGSDSTWRFLVFFGHNFETDVEDGRYRSVIFPLACWGRDAAHERYAAVFPFGGHIREFLGRDEIDFVLFPLYLETEVNRVRTRDVLFPLISWTRGAGVRRERFFPFYGRSVTEGRSRKLFVLWPIWTSASYYMPSEKGRAFILFPLVGRVNTVNQKAWMFIPPFFRWARSGEQTEASLPWPFVQYASGEMDKLYLWPLVGRKAVGHSKSRFLLWPLIQLREGQSRDHEYRRNMLFPFVYHEATRPLSTGGVTRAAVDGRHLKIWPLMSYERQQDETRFRLLSLWPLKNTRGMERNWVPIWTLYDRIRTPEQLDESLLWGLWRRRVDEDSRRVSLFPLFSARREGTEARKWSFLMGLAGYEREGLRKTYRLLYFFRHSTGKQAVDEEPGAQ